MISDETPLKIYNYPEDIVIAGTEDWQHVVSLSNYDYSWYEIGAYYSPGSRRYFWYEDSGCSCTSWGEDIESIADFQSGSRDDLLRAMTRFADEHKSPDGTDRDGWYLDPHEASSALATVRTHRGAR